MEFKVATFVMMPTHCTPPTHSQWLGCWPAAPMTRYNLGDAGKTFLASSKKNWSYRGHEQPHQWRSSQGYCHFWTLRGPSLSLPGAYRRGWKEPAIRPFWVALWPGHSPSWSRGIPGSGCHPSSLPIILLTCRVREEGEHQACHRCQSMNTKRTWDTSHVRIWLPQFGWWTG